MSVLVVVLAIVLRVAWVLAVPSKPVGDFAMYVEAAAHLAKYGAFDGEYVYMPGYIFLIAPVQAMGGGWLATKLVGAFLGGLGAGAVLGIARRVSGGSSCVALIAGLLYAIWPAGIAIASVTGTDMPAAVMVLAAAYVLVRFSDRRPTTAAVLFGVLTGLAAYIRAIVVPLAALSALVFRAQRWSWRASLRSAALASLVALVVLSPWAVRNRLRYGELFFTDSHGGLTALVGANPNTDGCYSRSLNRMFHDVTGFTLLAEPHREADRASLAIAKRWIAFDPLYTLGLLASKLERLLAHERALLYWPLFRAGVLPEPYRTFFTHHQAGIEALADDFYLAMMALALMGCGVAWARRQWLALSLVPQALALVVLYTVIFAEPRYRLPIFMLLIPFSAIALDWLGRHVRQLSRRSPWQGWRAEVAWALGPPVAIFALSPMLAAAGRDLRQHHRWAVSECWVDGRARFCKWRAPSPSPEGTVPEGLAGVWDGVGIGLSRAASQQSTVSTEAELTVAPGDYDISADLDLAPSALAGADSTGVAQVLGNGQALLPSIDLGRMASTMVAGQALHWTSTLHHPGGLLRVGIRVELPPASIGSTPPRLWISNVRLARRTM
jgi:hypothetical protein